MEGAADVNEDFFYFSNKFQSSAFFQIIGYFKPTLCCTSLSNHGCDPAYQASNVKYNYGVVQF